jgi:hypothetical protein
MTNPNMQWRVALEGPDPKATLRWLAERVWAGRSPEKLVVNYNARKPGPDWLARMCASCAKVTVAAYFTPDRSESLIAYRSGVIAASFPFPRELAAIRSWLEEAPFEVASFDTLFPEWETIDENYRPPSFSRNHFPHGWGCAFKGEGHSNLVSRRWLEFGPWVLIRGGNDLSLVQFHALDASAKQALEQARPGHKMMGIDDEGGFLQRPYVFRTALSGLYSSQEQVLRIVVLGRELAPIELLDACAARQQGALTKTQPLRQIAYVFPNPDDARRHLHALWLRELECWTVIDGLEQRLDMEYRPSPELPAWATA